MPRKPRNFQKGKKRVPGNKRKKKGLCLMLCCYGMVRYRPQLDSLSSIPNAFSNPLTPFPILSTSYTSLFFHPFFFFSLILSTPPPPIPPTTFIQTSYMPVHCPVQKIIRKVRAAGEKPTVLRPQTVDPPPPSAPALQLKFIKFLVINGACCVGGLRGFVAGILVLVLVHFFG